MSTFRLFERHSQDTEANFRFCYGKDVREKTMRCCNGFPDKDWCINACHFLVAEGIEHADDGYFPIHGIDCDVEILCWGGDDVENSTIETYCKECAWIEHQHRREREAQAEIAHERRMEQKNRLHVEKVAKQRAAADFWDRLSDTEFERQCAQLFRCFGFQADTTPATNDGGIDVLLRKDTKRGAVQCKAWQQPCGVKEVREFYGVICAEKMDFGYFISRSGFTESAKELLKKTPAIQGWDTSKVVERILGLDEVERRQWEQFAP